MWIYRKKWHWKYDLICQSMFLTQYIELLSKNIVFMSAWLYSRIVDLAGIRKRWQSARNIKVIAIASPQKRKRFLRNPAKITRKLEIIRESSDWMITPSGNGWREGWFGSNRTVAICAFRVQTSFRSSLTSFENCRGIGSGGLWTVWILRPEEILSFRPNKRQCYDFSCKTPNVCADHIADPFFKQNDSITWFSSSTWHGATKHRKSESLTKLLSKVEINSWKIERRSEC